MEDRRGQSGSYGGGIPFPLPLGKAGGSLGLVVLVVLVLLFGGNVIGGGSGGGPLAPGGVDETVSQAAPGAQPSERGSAGTGDDAYGFTKSIFDSGNPSDCDTSDVQL